MNSDARPRSTPESSRSRVLRWIRDSVRSGTLAPGDAVPSVRALAGTLRAPINATAAAVVDAEKEGLVVRHASGARKRYVPVPGTSLSNTMVCVFGRPSRFADDGPAPRWSDPFITSELFRRLADAGLHTLALNGATLRESDLDAIFRSRPAGLIAIDSVFPGTLSLRALERCRERGIPAVAYGNSPAVRAFDRVFTDHRAGARDLVRWLISPNRRRIVPFFPVQPSDTQDAWWIAERLAGYSDAMRDAGMEPLPCVRFGSDVLNGADDPERFRIYAALAFEKIALLRRDGGVDALMCINDEWAKPAIAAIGNLGLEPNRDILVTGYDNISSPTSFAAYEPRRPAATIDKHNEITAEEMAALLVARIAGKLPAAPQCRSHPHELVILS